MAAMARSLNPAIFQTYAGCFFGGDTRAGELHAAGIPILELPVRSMVKPSVIRGAWKMARFLRTRNIRLVHAFDVPTNVFAPLVVKNPLMRAMNSCVMLGSCRAHRDLIGHGTRRRMLRWTDRHVDGIVVNCEFLRTHLLRDEGVPERMIHCCPNGIDTEEFHSGGRERPPEFEEAELVIGVVCILRPEKGLPTLIEAFARVWRPGLKLAIVGSGPGRDDLMEQAKGLGIFESCVFVPAQARVAPYLRGMDIFVLPSLSEASSNSLMEAMATGCCPVATRVGGNPELVVEGTGLLFEKGDAADLATALARLIADPDLRKGMAGAAARRAAEHFTLQASVKRLQEIYLQCLEPSGTPSA